MIRNLILNLDNLTVVPAGTTVAFFPLEIHTDKKLWGEDANEYKPERFTNENFKKIHPYSFIPFLHGPRMCPGYKYAQITAKTFLAKFLLKYRVKSDLKYEDLVLQMNVTTIIKQGCMLKVERR